MEVGFMAGPFLTVTLLSGELTIVNLSTVAKIEPIRYIEQPSGEQRNGSRCYFIEAAVDTLDGRETLTQLADAIRHAS
jgi:hypothetical protein